MRFFEKALKRFLKQTFVRPITSRFKGWSGEQSTALSMWLFLDDKNYKRFHDVILPSSNGTAQLDHILVSTYGVFIVETKNKTGWIFGSEEQATWTQIVFKEKYTFQNPLRQTYRQKKVLATFIGINESCIFPVVYFIGDCEFKTHLPSNVINSGLPSYLNNFKEKIIPDDEVHRIVKILEQHLLESKLTSSDHVHSLEDRHNSKTTCPKCGGGLVMRTARKGSKEGSTFLGCMNYPQCRFTRNT